MSANLVVEMTGDEQRLFRSLQKVVAQQNQMEGGFKRVGKAGQQAGTELGRGFNKLVGSLTSVKGLLGGIGGAIAGGVALNSLANYANQYDRQITRMADANIRFDQSLRPVLTLGNNAGEAKAIREMILAQSTGFGVDPTQVAAAQAQVDASLGSYSKSVRETVMNQAMLGTRIGVGVQATATGLSSILALEQQALSALNGLDNKQREFVEVRNARLAQTADLASATNEQIFQYISRAYAPASLMGFKDLDLLSILPKATAISDSPERAFTQSANLFNRLPQFEEMFRVNLRGKEMGQVLDEMYRVTGGDITKFIKAFGTENAAFVAAIVNSRKSIADSRAQIEQASRNFMRQKAMALAVDEQSRAAQLINQANQQATNQDVRQLQNPLLRRQATEAALTIAGLREQDPLYQMLSEDTLGQMLLKMDGPARRKLAAVGAQTQIQSLRMAGDEFGADQMALQLAYLTGDRMFQSPAMRKQAAKIPDLQEIIADKSLPPGQRLGARTELNAILNRARGAQYRMTGETDATLFGLINKNPEAAATAIPQAASFLTESSDRGTQLSRDEYERLDLRTTQQVQAAIEALNAAAKAMQEAAEKQKQATDANTAATKENTAAAKQSPRTSRNAQL